MADAIEADFRKVDFIREDLVPNQIDQFMGDGLLTKYWHDLVATPDIPHAAEVLYLVEVWLYAEAVRKSKLSPEHGIDVSGALGFSNELTAKVRSAAWRCRWWVVSC